MERPGRSMSARPVARGAPAATRRPTVPKGRLELLQWVNALTGANTATVELLRSGAEYCDALFHILIHSMIGSKAATSAKINDALAGVVRIPLGDISSDTLQITGVLEKNFRLLESAVQTFVPVKLATDMDCERLAKGKLQSHVRLLEWLFGLSTKLPPIREAIRNPNAPLIRNKSSGGGGTELLQYDPANYSEERIIDDEDADEKGSNTLQEELLHSLYSMALRVEQLEHNILSVEDQEDYKMIQQLLEQRDVLWQTLVQVQQVAERGCTNPPPLMLELRRIFL